MKYAYFAAGCFWCITPVFMDAGAAQVISGYSGGAEENPTYEAVKHQLTGHRETAAVRYDEARVPYIVLLDAFLQNVDPFDGEGQFIDRGHSYTLAVYYLDEEERLAAESAIHSLEQRTGRTVCIAVEPFRSFFPAEEYHQDYYRKNPEAFEQELLTSGRKQKPDNA